MIHHHWIFLSSNNRIFKQIKNTTMKFVTVYYSVITFALVLVAYASAYTIGKIDNNNQERRTFITSTLTKTATLSIAVGIGTGGLSVPTYAAANDNDPYADYITTESGLRYSVLKEGTGEPPVPGAMVSAHYTGWLDGFDSERKFDSSRDRGRPFKFAVAKGQVIRGWDETFSSMTVGERRRIIIPPRLGYGDRGAGGIIPGGATLYFDVELLGIGK
jgi:peptidylprolyl isomerase